MKRNGSWNFSFGLRTMEAAAVGAQTGRPGVAVAGEGFAWPQDLTGRFVRPVSNSPRQLSLVGIFGSDNSALLGFPFGEHRFVIGARQGARRRRHRVFRAIAPGHKERQTNPRNDQPQRMSHMSASAAVRVDYS